MKIFSCGESVTDAADVGGLVALWSFIMVCGEQQNTDQNNNFNNRDTWSGQTSDDHYMSGNSLGSTTMNATKC